MPRRRLWPYAALALLLLGLAAHLLSSSDEPAAPSVDATAEAASRSPAGAPAPGPARPAEGPAEAGPDAGPAPLTVRVLTLQGQPVPGASVDLYRHDPAAPALACPCPAPPPEPGADPDEDSDPELSAFDDACACPAALEALFAAPPAPPAPEAQARTDAEGYARFPGLTRTGEGEGSQVTAWAQAEGYARTAATDDEEDADRAPLTIRLRPAHDLEVRVEDEAGRLLPQARLAAFAELPLVALAVQPLGGGRFRLPGAPHGDLELAATAPGLGLARTQLSDDLRPLLGSDLADLDDEGVVTLTLRAPRTLRGRVLAGGRPAAGAEVRLEGHPQAATTDARGRFVVPDAPAEDELVVVARLGSRRGRAVARGLEKGRQAEVEVELRELAVLEGQVLDARTRAPIAGAELSLDGEEEGEDDEPPRASARSGPDGAYRVELEPGRYTLSARSDSYQPFEAGLSVREGERARRDLALRPGATLAGRVVDRQGRPVAEAVVEVTPVRRPRSPAPPEDEREVTDEQGRFRLGGLPEGPARVQARAEGHLPGEAEVTLPAESELTLTLDTQPTLSVEVVDPAGRPVEGAQVRLRRAEPELDELLHPRGLRTGADGRVELGPVRPGPATVAVEAQGYAPAERQAELQAGAGAQRVRVALELGPHLAGRVVDASGRPRPGARVNVWLPAVHPFARGNRTVLAGPDGRFEAGGLQPGQVAFLLASDAEGSDGSWPRLKVTVPQEGLELVVRPRPRARGRVLLPDGSPVTAFKVDGFAVAAPDGRFDVPHLAPGGTLHLEGEFLPAEVKLPTPVEGRPDEAGDVVVDPGLTLEGVVLTADGRPVARHPLSVEPLDRIGAPFEPFRQVETDAQGRFAVPHLYGHPYRVELSGRGGRRTWEVAPGQGPVTLRPPAPEESP